MRLIRAKLKNILIFKKFAIIGLLLLATLVVILFILNHYRSSTKVNTSKNSQIINSDELTDKNIVDNNITSVKEFVKKGDYLSANASCIFAASTADDRKTILTPDKILADCIPIIGENHLSWDFYQQLSLIDRKKNDNASEIKHLKLSINLAKVLVGKGDVVQLDVDNMQDRIKVLEK